MLGGHVAQVITQSSGTMSSSAIDGPATFFLSVEIYVLHIISANHRSGTTTTVCRINGLKTVHRCAMRTVRCVTRVETGSAVQAFRPQASGTGLEGAPANAKWYRLHGTLEIFFLQRCAFTKQLPKYLKSLLERTPDLEDTLDDYDQTHWIRTRKYPGRSPRTRRVSVVAACCLAIRDVAGSAMRERVELS